MGRSFNFGLGLLSVGLFAAMVFQVTRASLRPPVSTRLYSENTVWRGHTAFFCIFCLDTDGVTPCAGPHIHAAFVDAVLQPLTSPQAADGKGRLSLPVPLNLPDPARVTFWVQDGNRLPIDRLTVALRAPTVLKPPPSLEKLLPHFDTLPLKVATHLRCQSHFAAALATRRRLFQSLLTTGASIGAFCLLAYLRQLQQRQQARRDARTSHEGHTCFASGAPDARRERDAVQGKAGPLLTPVPSGAGRWLWAGLAALLLMAGSIWQFIRQAL